MASPLRFGVDLGGTKIELIALDPDGKALLRRRIATPRNDYAATVAAVVTLVRQAESELGARGSVGIGTPGAISPATGRMNKCPRIPPARRVSSQQAGQAGGLIFGCFLRACSSVPCAST
ncbi:MAG: ROK family protein [Thiobacillus sp.]